jgi:hypothetical protein
MRILVTAFVAGLCLWFPVAYVLGAARIGRKGGIRDRVGIVDGFASALIALVLARLLLPWQTVPALLWAVPVAVTAYGTALAVRAWPALPWVTGRAPALRVGGAVLGVVITGVLAVAGA